VDFLFFFANMTYSLYHLVNRSINLALREFSYYHWMERPFNSHEITCLLYTSFIGYFLHGELLYMTYWKKIIGVWT